LYSLSKEGNLSEISNVLPEIKIIAGPTASGKTALAVLCAKEQENGAVIISADSMQIYEGLPIATAKPTAEELAAVPHKLIGIIPRNEEFSVAGFVRLAEAEIDKTLEVGKTPIVVGGTGLYISSLISGIDFSEESGDPEVRKRLRTEADQAGSKILWERLNALDPVSAGKIAPENTVRLIRALEIIEVTGKKFSDYRKENLKGNKKYCFDVTLIGLDDREELYSRINSRVDRMLKEGLVEECRAVYEEGSAGALGKAIGYKELVPYFEGKESIEAAAERLSQATRNYAKRQITWFRNQIRNKIG
jgi:tRNA dimethylallyltransferase